MPPRKKLIEVALPLEAINVASAREKSIRHGHPSTLHLWFARRPLAACRAVIFASLVDDPDDPAAPADYVAACWALPFNEKAEVDTARQRLFKFIELLVQWESTTNEAVLETARHLIRLATGGNPPPLLDPFAGGGSIPLEAQRLGLEAHASDLNPIPVMINKALIEIPPKFANRPPVNPRDRAKMGGDEGWKGAAGLAADVRYYGEWMRDRVQERIGHLYPKAPNGETVIAWIWARTVKSPNPAVNVHVPLVRSFELSKKQGHRAWIEPQIDPDTKQVWFTVRKGNGAAPKGTVERSGGRCIVSGAPIPFDYIRAEGKAGRLGVQLMAIVTEGNNGRNYFAPDEQHVQIALNAKPSWLPEQKVTTPSHDVDRLPMYGMFTWGDAFTRRQLAALVSFSDQIKNVRERVKADSSDLVSIDQLIPPENDLYHQSYANAISMYLSFAVDRCADYWSSIATWHTGNQQIRSTFARQAIPMTWDFAEANPFSGSSGGWLSLYLSTVDAFRSLVQGKEGHVKQFDAGNTDYWVQNTVISTDPPYYDNIGYADLSDFFYIWLRRSLYDVYPDIFSTLLAPKEAEIVASQYRFNGDKAKANKHFENGLRRAFLSMRRTAHPDYPLTVYYAFKQSEAEEDDDSSTSVASSNGWEMMLEGLIQAGFCINGTLPIRSEQYHRMIAHGSNALASSIVLVCRPRPDDASTASRRQFTDSLRRELPAALRELQSGNIAPVDLAQASIGPGMAIYSRYSQVLEANGQPLSIRTALQLINQELDAYLAETEGDVDADTRFAINWFEQFDFREGDFGQADVLARAKNTSVAGVVAAGIARSAKGKVQLLRHTELDPGYAPFQHRHITVWEALTLLLERLLGVKDGGEDGAARLLLKLPGDLGSEARVLAYRLYNICERKGWAEYAFDYNSLVISWPRIQEIAHALRQAATEPTQQSFDV